MAATIMDGRVVRDTLMPELRNYAQELRDRHRCVPTLAALLVGDDAASRQYVRNKQKLAGDLGFNSKVIALDSAGCTTDSLLATIDELNRDSAITGILIQLPLPDQV